MRIIVIFIFILSASCIRNSHLVNLKDRFASLNAMLSPSESKLFKQQQFMELGAILDHRESQDVQFAKHFRDIKFAEAILTFDGHRSVHFFYHVILYELLKKSYHDFLQILDIDDKKNFVYQLDMQNLCAKKCYHDFLQNVRKQCGLFSFSCIEILYYYREICFPKATFPEVYNILVFFWERQCLDAFLTGQFSEIVKMLLALQKSSRSTYSVVKSKSQKDLNSWIASKERMGFTNLSDHETMLIIKHNVMETMNLTVFENTVSNVKSLPKGMVYASKSKYSKSS